MKILISQNEPANLAAYDSLKSKYGVEIDFRPFFLIEPLPSKDFRAQHINLQDYTAVCFSSRHAIDAYFKLCEELRVKVPDTMKYFCVSEHIAVYLQKHIVYRKRKIFFGDGKADSLVSVIGSKHKGDKFLITFAEGTNTDRISALFKEAGLDFDCAALVRPVSQKIKDIDLSSYNLCVLYNPADVKSLYENYPDFKQGNLKFISYGKTIVKAMEEAGLSIEIKAPTPEATSAAKAIDIYLSRR